MVRLGGRVRTRGKAKNRRGVYLNGASVAQLEATSPSTAWGVGSTREDCANS